MLPLGVLATLVLGAAVRFAAGAEWFERLGGVVVFAAVAVALGVSVSRTRG